MLLMEFPQTTGWFRRLLERTRDAFICIDRHGTITFFNESAETMFGYERAEVIGKNVNVLMPDPYRSEHDQYMKRYATSGERKAIGKIRVVEARRKRGEVFPIELSVTELTEEGNNNYAAFIRDITDKAKLRDELVERERLAAIGTTSATLAHEIGNPLNNLLLNTKLLERRLARAGIDDAGILSTLSVVSNEITRLQDILNEFRAFMRRMPLHKTKVDCAVFVRDLADTTRAEFEEDAISLDLSLPETSEALFADPAKLKQAMINLLKNAAEATSSGGTVRLSAECLGPMFRFAIHDDGPGVPEGVEIFEPFCTTKTRGTGLGLPIAKQIVRNHGGRIEYRSEAGVGTTFYVWIPAFGA